MTDSQEKSDDLIAELAKLMASNAQGAESEPAPSVIKLTPLSEATVPPPSPVRIPGMAAAAAPKPAYVTAPAPAAPSPMPPVSPVRIPGMPPVAAVPSPAPEPAPAAPAPVAAAPKPAFDFGAAPSSVAPSFTPEPMTNWQDREVPKPPVAAPRPTPAPVPLSPSFMAPKPVEPTVSAPVLKPMYTPAPMVPNPPAPTQTPAPAATKPVQTTDDGFNFDFGFSAEPPTTGSDGQSPEHDPIADLIAAELDAAERAPEPAPEPRFEAPKPTPIPQQPASVEAVPARNFGNSATPEAPVLIAHPTGTAPRPAMPPQLTPRPVNVAPRPASEPDRFNVAPVFGLGGKVSTPAPAPVAAPVQRAAAADFDNDPMSEIESLIGEAVRVDLAPDKKPVSVQPMPAPVAAPVPAPTPAPQATPVAAPVVPPLTTGFAPRRAQLKDAEPQMHSAEAAILAAAAATGAEVGRIDAPVAEESPYKRMKVKPPKTNFFSGGVRQYVGLAVAGTLLLAAGFGLYWVLGMGRGGDPSTAPVLTADAGPTKQAAPIVAAASSDAPRSVVFDEIDGVASADDAETLVSRDQTEGATPTEVARVVPQVEGETESGLANRKVRTVTVRPDGTIVSGDEAVAGSEALPVDRPNVPALPGGEAEPSDLLTAAVSNNAADPIAALAAEGGAAPSTEPLALAAANATPAVFDGGLVAPIPMPRPSDRSALVGGSAAPAPAAQPTELVASAQPPVTETSSSNAAAYVQLSSQRSEGDAQASLRSVQSRFGGAFGGNALEIQRADLGAKGVYYRVRLPASSLQEATQICASIKANGGDCFATGA